MSSSDFYDRLKKSTPAAQRMVKQSSPDISRAVTEPAIQRVSSVPPPSNPPPISPRKDPRAEPDNDDPKTPSFKINYLEESKKLFETSDIICYHNGSGDLFVKNKRSEVECKISSGYESLSVSVSASNIMEPTLHHGLSAMKITKRSK